MKIDRRYKSVKKDSFINIRSTQDERKILDDLCRATGENHTEAIFNSVNLRHTLISQGYCIPPKKKEEPTIKLTKEQETFLKRHCDKYNIEMTEELKREFFGGEFKW